VDRGRNYYNCGGFGHMARYCRSQRIIEQRRRIKYEDNYITRDNFLKKESLVVLD